MLEGLFNSNTFVKLKSGAALAALKKSSSGKKSAKKIIDETSKENGDANQTKSKLHLAWVVGGTNHKLSLLKETDGQIVDAWNASIDNSTGHAVSMAQKLIAAVYSSADKLFNSLDLVIAWAGRRAGPDDVIDEADRYYDTDGKVTRQNVKIHGYANSKPAPTYQKLYPLAEELSKAIDPKCVIKMKSHYSHGNGKGLWLNTSKQTTPHVSDNLKVYFAGDIIYKILAAVNARHKDLKPGHAIQTFLSGTGYSNAIAIGRDGKEPLYMKPYSGTEKINEYTNSYNDWVINGQFLEPFRDPNSDSTDYWIAGGRDDNPYMGLKATANYLSGKMQGKAGDPENRLGDMDRTPIEKSGDEITDTEKVIARLLFGDKSVKTIKEKMRKSDLIQTQPKKAWTNADVMKLAREGDSLAEALCQNLAGRAGRINAIRHIQYMKKNKIDIPKKFDAFYIMSSNALDLLGMGKSGTEIEGVKEAFVDQFNLAYQRYTGEVREVLQAEDLHEYDAPLEAIPELIESGFNFEDSFGRTASGRKAAA